MKRFLRVPLRQISVVRKRAKEKRHRNQPDTTEFVRSCCSDITRDSLKKELHSWGHASSCCENERGEIGLFDLIDSCFVFSIFLLFRFVKESFVGFVDVASGEWRNHFDIKVAWAIPHSTMKWRARGESLGQCLVGLGSAFDLHAGTQGQIRLLVGE